MAGRGPAPKPTATRRNQAVKVRGDWQPAPGTGWQYEPFPTPPTGLLKPSRDAWETWFRSWFAANWTPDDLPGLRQVIRLYDQVERKQFQRASELRLAMDTYGITPKGQQDRRWLRPTAGSERPQPETPETPPKRKASAYRHLQAVS
jgi:hypothetical protein